MGMPTYQALLDQVKAAEDTGFDAVWMRDHVSIAEITGNPLNLECWTTLSAVSRDTTRIRLGTLVICNGWRNAALLAKMAATLDVISGGRLIMGMGAGFLQREWEEYGYTFPPAPDRI